MEQVGRRAGVAREAPLCPREGRGQVPQRLFPLWE